MSWRPGAVHGMAAILYVALAMSIACSTCHTHGTAEQLNAYYMPSPSAAGGSGAVHLFCVFRIPLGTPDADWLIKDGCVCVEGKYGTTRLANVECKVVDEVLYWRGTASLARMQDSCGRGVMYDGDVCVLYVSVSGKTVQTRGTMKAQGSLTGPEYGSYREYWSIWGPGPGLLKGTSIKLKSR